MPITPSLLALIGRELATHGEFLADIRYAGGMVHLIPAAASYVVHGGGDPTSWIYSLTTFGPTDSRTYQRPRADVLHLLYGQTSAASWRGVPPWASASLSGRLLAGVERQLAGEASSASGYFMVGPDVGDRSQAADSDGSTDPTASILSDMAAARGRTMIAPTMKTGYGAGSGAAPEHDYESVRFGMSPPTTTIEVRRDMGCWRRKPQARNPATPRSRKPAQPVLQKRRTFRLRQPPTAGRPQSWLGIDPRRTGSRCGALIGHSGRTRP